MIQIKWYDRPYVWLLSISAILFLIYVGSLSFSIDNRIVVDVSGRLSASVFGAYLTAILVDGVFREKEQEKENKIRDIAFDELSTEISAQMRLLEELYKASTDEIPDRDEIETLKDLIDSGEFEEVRMLDLFSTCPRGNLPDSYTWADEIHKKNEELEEEIDKIVKKYGFVLESEQIETMKELSNSEFSELSSAFTMIKDDHEVLCPLLTNSVYECFIEYLELLEAVSDEVGDGFDDYELKLIDVDNVVPNMGQGRVKEIDLDEAVEMRNSD